MSVVVHGDYLDCPFCDGQFSPIFDPKTRQPTGLVHTMPMCETFDRLDVLEFARAVNAVRQPAAGEA